MKFGFDLDGTLDKKELADLARVLLDAGHEVHVITGVFPDAGDWQSPDAKRAKVLRLGFSYKEMIPPMNMTEQHGLHPRKVTLHILNADITLGREDRLIGLGLQKGALCETLGIQVFLDDSELYCKMIPSMAGGVSVLRVL